MIVKVQFAIYEISLGGWGGGLGGWVVVVVVGGIEIVIKCVNGKTAKAISISPVVPKMGTEEAKNRAKMLRATGQE